MEHLQWIYIKQRLIKVIFANNFLIYFKLNDFNSIIVSNKIAL